MIDKIRTDTQYKQVLEIIENYLQKATKQGGFSTLNKAENSELAQLSQLVELYEDSVLKLMPLPVTIGAIVQQKAHEKNLNQRALATLFGMGTAKISQILNGKRQPDLPFLKAVHEKLGIDGNFLLERI